MRLLALIALLIAQVFCPLFARAQTNAAHQNYPSLADFRAAMERERESLQSEKNVFDQQCGLVDSRNTQQIAECQTRQDSLAERVSRFNKALQRLGSAEANVEFYDKRISELDGHLASTRREIQRFNVQQYQAALDEWTKINEGGEHALEAREIALGAFIDTMLEGSSQYLEARLDKNTLALYTGHSSDEYTRKLVAALTAVNRADLARQSARIGEAKFLFSILGAMKDAFDGSVQIARGGREQRAELTLKTIGVLNGALIQNPYIGLLISDGELVVADSYLGASKYLAHQRFAQLEGIGEQRLQALKLLSARYVTDVNERAALQKQRSTLLSPN